MAFCRRGFRASAGGRASGSKIGKAEEDEAILAPSRDPICRNRGAVVEVINRRVGRGSSIGVDDLSAATAPVCNSIGAERASDVPRPSSL